MRRILVTGFEIFSDHSSNISQDLVLALPDLMVIEDPWKKSRGYNLDDLEVELVREVLTVDENGSKKISSMLDSGITWDAIIHLGLCESCLVPRIELTASKILDMKIPDNLGRMKKSTNLGVANYQSSIDYEITFSNVLGQEFELSNDAGSYICNETYYFTLQTLINRGTYSDTPCLFLHLPSYQNITLESSRVLLSEILGRISFKPVVNVAAGVIFNESTVLVARRNDRSNRGLWEFPGGKLNFGETPSQAIERELKEEFDWNVKSIEHLGNWFHTGTDYDIELCVQRCEFIGAMPDFNDKVKWTSHDKIEWISNSKEVGPYVGSDEEVARKVTMFF